MELNKEFLEKAKDNLGQQYKELAKEKSHINEAMAEVRGALRWVEQTIRMLDKPLV